MLTPYEFFYGLFLFAGMPLLYMAAAWYADRPEQQR